MKLPTGSKSLLFGAHQFLLHPLFVAVGWWKLYGFPWHPFLWACFFLHDVGYWGKAKMDDEEGETHPVLGAALVGLIVLLFTWSEAEAEWWARFCACHSRYYARLMKKEPSQLCAADKLVVPLMGEWFYLTLIRWSGELAEYRDHKDKANLSPELRELWESGETGWYAACSRHLQEWALSNAGVCWGRWGHRYAPPGGLPTTVQGDTTRVKS